MRLVATGLCAILAACALPGEDPPGVDTTRRPLIGGQATDGDPAVVAITTPTGGIICTATLISPQVVLTAAHCIDDIGGDPQATAFFGSDTTGEGTRIGFGGVQRHLEWTSDFDDGHDIGMLLLNYPVEPDLPVPLNRSSAENHLGEDYRVVGFGVSDRGPPMVLDGKKRTGLMVVDALVGDVINGASDTTSICFGDSGGPGFLTVDGEEVIAGVHSYTFNDCRNPSGDTRVDLYADDFVQPWVDANDPSCGNDGLCAYKGCTDDPDCQPCGADGTCTEGCDLPDPDCPTSELGEICRADSQCVSGLCVFWEGDLGYEFCTRECDPAAADCPAGMSCRAVGPFGDICYWDEPPAGVLGDACSEPTDCGSYVCEESTCVRPCDVSVGKLCPEGFQCSTLDGADYYCHATGGGGGCSASDPATGASTTALVLLALALLLLRARGGRRRRPDRRAAPRPRSRPAPGGAGCDSRARTG